jgi:hypothetical protein
LTIFDVHAVLQCSVYPINDPIANPITIVNNPTIMFRKAPFRAGTRLKRALV